MTGRARGTDGAAPMNRLACETSPYLLQHAANPVGWYPWGEEAFRAARDQDKPIFLSIGYSTCHWCHVMARESFEDPEVARLVNDAFVPVKVDREERPDVDHVYMTVCQMITGSGGWPLTIIMTPDGRPFYAATYVPRENRFGLVGLLNLVPQIKAMWASRREEVLAVADQIATGLGLNLNACLPDSIQGGGASAADGAAMGEAAGPTGGEAGGRADREHYLALLRRAYDGLAGSFDEQHGGFGGAPKFPMPHNLVFLLRYWKRTGEERALTMARRTLDAMRSGGIYDHLGFGFHRYSTDAAWLVPHFEKMLYDQALLAIAYTEAFLATGREEYRAVAEETLEYVLRDLASPEGGFHCGEDADSEGEEGKFYVWSLGDVREALGGDDADLARRLFGLTEKGNVAGHPAGLPPGSNILHHLWPPDRVATDLGLSPQALAERLGGITRTLLARRGGRVRPGKDDKILADWNGLAIAALARASRVSGKSEHAAAASRAADFVLTKMRSPAGRLFHSWRGGRPGFPGNLDDYAFMIWGLAELYESSSQDPHLAAARELTDVMIAHFWDPEAGGFYFTADDGEKLLFRPKLVYDGALPAGNSVAYVALIRLAHLTGDQAVEARAASLARWLYGSARKAPLAQTQYLAGLELAMDLAR